MLEHKFSRLLIDYHLSRSDDHRVRRGLPHTLQTEAIGGAVGNRWEDGRLDGVNSYSWNVNISFNLGSHKAASLVAKQKENVQKYQDDCARFTQIDSTEWLDVNV